MRLERFTIAATIASVSVWSTSASLAQITIPTVLIGNAGNVADPFTGNLYGSVAYEYKIGATEVTNAQYAAFLNAVAATDTFTLYNTNMAGPFGGITRSGSPGSYTYGTISGRANNPVNFVSFWETTRFANWLHNGQPTGAQDDTTTEDGAYTLTPSGISANTITRNAGWEWAVTSENEWYKAAFHQPASSGGDSDNYWQYATSSNFVPSTSQANYASIIGNTAPVGSYAANFYGTFDMGGNVWEWNEAITLPPSGSRGFRGAGWRSGDLSWLSATGYRDGDSTGYIDNSLGFRVSQRMPCPSDLNGDWLVDDADFVIFAAAYEAFSVPPAHSAADLTADGFVDDADFVLFAAAYERFACP